MGTKFSDIYNRAIMRFSDYAFLNIYHDKRDDIMRGYLAAACADFQHSSAIDLTEYSNEDESFVNELTDEIQEILALGIAYHWVSAKALDSELLRNSMTRKDYQTYSPANLLKEVRELRDALYKEFRGKMNEYSYRHGTLDTIKAGKKSE